MLNIQSHISKIMGIISDLQFCLLENIPLNVGMGKKIILKRPELVNTRLVCLSISNILSLTFTVKFLSNPRFPQLLETSLFYVAPRKNVSAIYNFRVLLIIGLIPI